MSCYNMSLCNKGHLVGTLPPLIKGGQDLPKIDSLGGVQNVLLERDDKPEKGGGGVPLFYYFKVQSHLLCVWGK